MSDHTQIVVQAVLSCVVFVGCFVFIGWLLWYTRYPKHLDKAGK